jgi:hypothetical protein
MADAAAVGAGLLDFIEDRVPDMTVDPKLQQSRRVVMRFVGDRPDHR